jgi:hypothetical protein
MERMPMGEKGLRRNAKQVAWQALRVHGHSDAMSKWNEQVQKWNEQVQQSEDASQFTKDHPQPEHPGFDQWQLASERGYNAATGQNAAWDDETGAWVDTKTGKPLTLPLLKE